jgi:hypothetical protein
MGPPDFTASTSSSQDHVLQQPADQRLGLLATPGADVEQRAAGLAEGDQLRGGVVQVGVLAVGGRAEPQPGHDQAAVADRALLHGRAT